MRFFANLVCAIMLCAAITVSNRSVAQSNHTVTFSGSTADFNASEAISAAASNTDYYITFDGSNLYLGAFRTSGSFGSADNFAVYLDTDPNSTPTSGNGTTAGQSYNGVTGTLPFSANYNVHAEETYQEARDFASSWASTISGVTYHTGSTWREVAIPFSSIGSPDALYITMWMGYTGGIFSNAPGADLGSGANPTVVNYIGGFGVSSVDCIPVNTTDTPITASLTDAVPASGITYGKITINASNITATNDFNIAAGGSLNVTGSSFDISGRTILMGGASAGTGRGTTINYTGGTLTTDNTTAITFNGEGLLTGNALTYNAAITVNRKFTPLSGGNTTIGTGGSIDLRANSYVNANALTYAANSILMYNTGNTFTAGVEWTANATSGSGVPSNVLIGNNVANSVLSFGTSAQFRHVNGSVTVSNTTSGNGLTLSTSAGGDLQLTGNFVQNGTFTHNSRAVTFNGTAAQTISGTLNTAGAANNFAYLILNNTHASGVTLNSSARITATSGDVLQLLNSGPLNIGTGATLTLENNGGNVRVTGGVRTVNFNTATSVMSFTGTKTVAATSGGTLSFTSSASFGTVAISVATNFGAALTTIGNNTYLQINNGGAVSTNAVTYASGSTLNYNTAGAYGRSTEWNATSGAGFPHHVLISNSGTALDINNGSNTARSCGGNLTINDGCTLSMGSMTGALSVGGNVTVGAGTSGTLTLSSAGGGNLNVAGNFTKNSGTLTPNARTVTFNGAGAQAFSSNATETIATVVVSNTSGTVSINSSITISTAVTFNANTTSVIGSSAALTMSQGSTFNGSNAGSTITVNGTLRNTGSTGATINSSAATLTIGSTGTYDHNITQSGQANLGTIPTSTWTNGSTCLISGLTNPNAGAWFAGGATQTFRNFTWNTASLTTIPNMAGATLTCTQTFTMTTTNSGALRMGTNSSGTITCGGYAQTGGILDFASGNGSGTLNCSGTFNQTGGTIQESGTGTAHFINFNGSSTQSITIISPSTDFNYTFNNVNGFTLNSAISVSNNRTVNHTRGAFSGAGSISYGATGTTLNYNGSAAITTSNYEWPSASGPVNVISNNAAGISLHATRTIGGVLTLSNGVFNLGANNLTISNSATGAITTGGSYSATNMIAASGAGQLIRALATGANTYLWPIGDVTSTTEYSPVQLAFTANSVTRNIGVNVVDAAHPQVDNAPVQTDYLTRHWQLSNSAAGNYTYTGSFTYVAADVVGGAASNIRVNYYSSSAWTQDGGSISASNVLTTTTGLTQVTGPLPSSFDVTGRVNSGNTYVWNQTGTANFTTAGNWTPSRSNLRADDILVFNNGATTTATNVPNQTIGQLLISGNTTVSFTTTAANTLTIGGNNGTDFSIASGSTLNITSANGLTVSHSNSCVGSIDGTLTISNLTTNAFNTTNSVTTVTGTINNIGVVTGSLTSLLMNSGSTYNHNWTTAAGTIPTANWDDASTCRIQGYTSNTAQPTGIGQAFGHFIWNCAGQTGDVQLTGGLTTIDGNFTVSSTNGNELRLTNTTSYTLNVGGNMSISTNNTELRMAQGNGTYTATINVLGNYTQSNNSTLHINNGDGNTTARLYVAGNFNFSAGTITAPQGLNNLIEWNGSSAQAITIAGTMPTNAIDYRVNNTAGFTLTGTIPVNNNSTFYRTAGAISGGTITYNATGTRLVYEGTTAMTTGVEFPATNGPEDVTINSTNTITLSGSRTLPAGGIFTNSNGIFALGNFDLQLNNTAAGAIVNASPSASNMIATSGTGQLKRSVSSAINLLYPIGDITGTAEYSPFSLNFSFVLGSYVIGIRVIDDTAAVLSTPYSPIDYLSRFWVASVSGGISISTYIPSMTYNVPGDVNGTENNLQVAVFPAGASAWNHYSTTLVSPTITKSGAALNDLNFLLNGAIFSGRTPVKYWDGSTSTDWNTSDNWTPSGVPISTDNIDFNGNASNPCVLSGSATVNHLTMSDGGNLTVGSGGSLTIAGNFTYNNTSSLTFDCNSTLSLTNTTFNQTVPAITYGNLILGTGARTLANSGTINICGNYTPTTGALTTTGSTVNFNGTAAQSILTNATSFNNLMIANTSGNVNSAANVTINGAMTVNAGARFNKTTNGLTIASGATATINGYLRNAATVTPTGTLTVANGGTYEHNTTTPGTIPTATWQTGSTCELIGNFSSANLNCQLQNFHHFKVNFSGSGNVNTNETLKTIGGDFTIAATGTGIFRLSDGGTNTMTVAGDLIQTGGTFYMSTGNNTDWIIMLTGDYSQTAGAMDMYSGGASGTGDIYIQGNYSRNGTGTITATGSGTDNGRFYFEGTTQSIYENSSALQNNMWIDYIITSGSTTSLLSDLKLHGTSATYTGTMNTQSGGILDVGTYVISSATSPASTNDAVIVSSGGTIRTANTAGLNSTGATGSVQTATRTFNSGGTYEYNGTANQNTGTFFTTTSTANTVANLIFSNTATTVTLNSGSNPTVTGVMTFGSVNTANFDVGVQTVYINNTTTAAVVRTGTGHVIGNLKRRIASGSNVYNWHVGTSTGYSPAHLTLTTSAAGGANSGITIRATDGVHPQAASSTLSTTAYVNRYWTVTNASSNLTASSSQFTYLPADLVGGATAATMGLERYSAGWTGLTETSVTNQITGSGLNGTTTFGDFRAAADCSSFTATITPGGATTFCTGGSVALTASSNISGSTYSWSPATGLDATNVAAVTANPTSTQTYTVTATSPQNCVDAETVTVTVLPLPTAAINGTDNICYNTGSFINFSGTAGATVTYTVNAGPNQNIVLNGGGTASLNSGNLTATTTYTLVSVDNGYCIEPATGSAVLTVAPQLVAGIGGSSSICQGAATNITFTGTPSATITYTIDGGANQTVVLSGGGNAFVNTGDIYTSSTVYALVSITDGTCSASASGSATITTTQVPEAAISGTISICSGSFTNIDFEGTPGATVTYTVNGGPNQTIMLNGSGLATLNTGALVINTTYALVSVVSGGCTETLTGDAVVTMLTNTYFADTDGDGFGDAGISACTNLPGYVNNDDDCDDSDAALNPNTNWYADLDGDGFGSYIYSTQCADPLVAGVVQTGGDCDDSNPLVYPTSAEICLNGIDDDCDGFVDEGCTNPPANDSFSNAASVSTSGVAYPVGNCYNGTLIDATVSPEGTAGNVGGGGGHDVWYKIVAPSSALRVLATTSSMNIVLELHNSSAVQLDVENDLNAIGNESMNTTGLTVGATYYIAVRSHDGVKGPFNICVQSLGNSYCNDGSGAYELCSAFKPKWTGANGYTFNFTPTGITPGVPTSGTSASQISLSTGALALRHGGTYDVTIDATYVLPEETVVVTGSSVCSISINAHASVEVKAEQRCGYPATLLKGSVLQGKPFVCAALNFTLEFTEMNVCAGAPIGMPFYATTIGPSSTINLSTVAGVVGGGKWYSVRWQPNFIYGAGAYGIARVIYVGGSAMGGDVYTMGENSEEKTTDAILVSNVYPNPNNGETLQLSITGEVNEKVQLRMMDSSGKLIYSTSYIWDGMQQVTIQFDQALANGIYLVEVATGAQTTTHKLIVQR
ncbi:MAG: MopE-related protein [Flavobacteriales bacterium]